MQWHTGWGGSPAGEEQTPPNGVSVCLPSTHARDICCDSIYYILIFPNAAQEIFCQPVHKLSPICAGMSETLNKKQLKEKLWNPNLVASESIFWSNSVTPADLDHPGVPRFFQWCGRNLFSHKVVNLVEQSCLFAQHVHWCDLNCQRKEGSRERLWVVCAWSHLVSPSKAVNSRIHWRTDLNSNGFLFCVEILKPES